jgi:signal transduction histidine kinase
MLHIFLTTHRAVLIERCSIMVAGRSEPTSTAAVLLHGVPSFIDQLIKTLRIEQSPEPMRSLAVSGNAGRGGPSEIGATATLHGRELRERGFSLEQVVRDYGDLCQAITSLAYELGETIEVDEFRTFNRCLDNAIADAVTEYAHGREAAEGDESVKLLNARLGPLAHELRNLVHTATLAVSAIKAGNVGISGATGAVLDRCLMGLRSLIDRSLAEVRVTAGLPPCPTRVSLADFIAEAGVSASLDARARECKLTVYEVDRNLEIYVDRDMLSSAVGNLLQNAFKFTKLQSEVSLHAYAKVDRILVDIEDRCGGLPRGAPEKMFRPFNQLGEDHSGLGLGLDICRRSVEANQGVLSVRDLPGVGCVFTIDLPRVLSAEGKA